MALSRGTRFHQYPSSDRGVYLAVLLGGNGAFLSNNGSRDAAFGRQSLVNALNRLSGSGAKPGRPCVVTISSFPRLRENFTRGRIVESDLP